MIDLSSRWELSIQVFEPLAKELNSIGHIAAGIPLNVCQQLTMLHPASASDFLSLQAELPAGNRPIPKSPVPGMRICVVLWFQAHELTVDAQFFLGFAYC